MTQKRKAKDVEDAEDAEDEVAEAAEAEAGRAEDRFLSAPRSKAVKPDQQQNP